jgi:foldase protein PrsA
VTGTPQHLPPSGPRSLPFVLIAILAAAIIAAGVLLFVADPFGGDDVPGSVPAGAVAVVGDETISRAEFDRWLSAAARSQSTPGTGPVVVPDPPSFTRCVEAKARSGRDRGQPREAVLDECRSEYNRLRDQVMQFLISGEWLEQEAAEREIQVDDAQVRQQFEDQKRQSFGKEADYEEFLRTSGQTEEDLLYRVRLDILANKIRDEVVRDTPEVTDADIEEYYRTHREDFARQTLEEVRETIRTRLVSERQQSALDEYVVGFRRNYRDKTVCAPDFRFEDCRNGPKPKEGEEEKENPFSPPRRRGGG